MSKILSYRGLLKDGGQDRILLSTRKGEAGYRITKFELFPNAPGVHAVEHVMKVFSVEQGAITGFVDFSDTNILASAYVAMNYAAYYGTDMVTIFDTAIVNQDIFITHSEIISGDGYACNYHLELEKIKLSEHEAMVTTIQSIRSG